MEKFREIITNFIEKDIPFLKRTGLKIVSLAPCRVKLMLPRKNNENHVGTLYAGALFTLSEVPGGILFYTTFDHDRFFPIVKEMSIQFKRPATTNVFVEVSMDPAMARDLSRQAEEKGKADYALEAEIKDEKGIIVAVSKGLYQMRRCEPDTGN